MEQDAFFLNEGLLTPSPEEEYQYNKFLQFEGRRKESTEIFIDEETGWRWRWESIAMTRGAKDENHERHKVFLDPLPHVVRETYQDLRGWYQAKVDPGHRPRPCFTEAVLTQPYSGSCQVMCNPFCYINAGMRGWRGTGITVVPKDYGEFVRKQLKKMQTSAAGYFTSFSEPFMPGLEAYYKNTRNGATAFVDAGLPIFFLSRCPYPDWAIDLIRKNKFSYAQKSINTSNEEDWAKLSPRAQPLKEHIEEIRVLKKAGIYVSIQVNPIIPGVTEPEEIIALIHWLAEVGADHLIFKHIEISYPMRQTMIDRISQKFGDNRGGVFRSLFDAPDSNIGGQATISEEYRKEVLDLYYDECKKVGVTSAVCYEYEYERDAQGKIVNKIGKSMGGRYLTADQCHGQRVPLHTRVTPDAPFTEVAECPPSGCLTCSDTNGGKPRCGSELFGAAKALRLPDLKQPVYGK